MTIKNLFKKIYAVSKKMKTDIYVVGGFVRDELLENKEKKDIDFVVLGSGLEFAKKFDKELKYIRKWIPELDSFEYPKPIVEHAFARDRCLATYKTALS